MKLTERLAQFAIVFLAASMTTGCAPIISGTMNASLDESGIFEKTASHFGVPREKLVIYNVKNDILATSYKAHYASKAYNCSIYYGQVTCEVLGSTVDFPAQNLIPNVAAPVNISSAKPDQTIPPNQSMSFMQAQIRLNQLGYSVGKPDGVFGKRSVEKLKLFQKSRGISMSGALDAQTVEALAAP